MKTRIILLVILCLSILTSCEDDEQNDLTGTWNFIEPPHPRSRINRNQEPTPVFDVIFTIVPPDENTRVVHVSDVDLVLEGEYIEDEVGWLEGTDLIIEGGGMSMRVKNMRRISQRVIDISGADYTINGVSKTVGPHQIQRY